VRRSSVAMLAAGDVTGSYLLYIFFGVAMVDSALPETQGLARQLQDDQHFSFSKLDK